jgi:hypothetical protein
MDLKNKKVTKLTGSNYHEWSTEMTEYLAANRLNQHIEYASFVEFYDAKHVVSDQEKRFDDRLNSLKDQLAKKMISLEKHDELLDQLEQRFHNDLSLWSAQKAKSLENWNQENDQVCAIIRSSIDDSLKSSVKDEKVAVELWKKLKIETSTSNIGSSIVLFTQWFNAQLKIGESLTDFLNRLHTIYEQIRALGKNIPLDLHCYKVLCSLPSQYETITMTLFQTPEKDLTHTLLKNRFGLEDSRKIASNISNSSQVEKSRDKGKGSANAAQPTQIRKCAQCANILPKNHNFKNCQSCYDKFVKSRNKQREEKKEVRKEKEKKKSAKGNAVIKRKKKKNDSHEENSSVSTSCCVRACTTSLPITSTSVYLDSGTSHNVTYDKNDLLSPQPIKNFSIEDAHGNSSKAKCKGNLKAGDLLLEEAVCDPSFNIKLASVGAICDDKTEKRDVCVVFTKTDAFVIKDAIIEGEVIGKATRDDSGLYAIDNSTTTTKANANAAKSKEKVSLQEAHERLGHAFNIVDIINLEDLDLLPFKLKDRERASEFKCDSCELANMPRKKFNRARKREAAKVVGERIHSDICGKLNVVSQGGKKYFVTYIDEFSDFLFVKCVRKKSEAFEEFKRVRAFILTQTSAKVKTLLTDSGGEYISNEFSDYLEMKGIVDERTPTDTSQLNGKAERINRSIMNAVRAMLKSSGLPTYLWGEAVKYYAYIRNRCVKRGTDTTRYELFYERKPTLKKCHKFGCAVTFHNPNTKKLEPRGREGLFVGVEEDDIRYRIFDIEKRKIINSRDVSFHPEREYIFEDFDLDLLDIVEGGEEKLTPSPVCNLPDLIDDDVDEEELITTILGTQNVAKPPEAKVIIRLQDQIPRVVKPVRRSTRLLKDQTIAESYALAILEEGKVNSNITSSPVCLGLSSVPSTVCSVSDTNSISVPDLICAYASAQEFEIIDNTPKNYAEAYSSPQAHLWDEAIKDEINSLSQMKTFQVVDRPAHKKVIGSKYVFKVKTNENGSISKYKVRIVAKGYSQVEGIDFNETFAPVLRPESLRFILSFSSANNFIADNMDVKTAFLYGDLDEEVYMEIPEGYDIDRKKKVFKLKKSIYGLKQASRIWNEKFTEEVKKLGYQQSQADPCLFYRMEKDKIVGLIGIVVDDVTLAIKNQREMERVKLLLSEKFEMKDMGSLTHIIGIKIEQSIDGISLSQEKYIDLLLHSFNMEHCKPQSTPLPTNMSNHDAENLKPFSDIKAYQRLIGSLIYLANMTRPDISYATSYLARKLIEPTNQDYIHAKRVLRYLKGTRHYRITYGRSSTPLLGYSDASYADADERKSTGGYVFLMNGGPISWKSRKQSIVALSSTEAEFIALADTAKEALWWRKILREIDPKNINVPTTILEDNQSAIKLSKNHIHNDRSKHIDVRCFFIRDYISKLQLDVKYVPTNLQIADMFTKSLSNEILKKFVKLLNLTP